MLGWLSQYGLTVGGSVLFIGGLLWLLQAGALPVVPPLDAWAGVRGWAIAFYAAQFIGVHLLRCWRWRLLIPRDQRPSAVRARRRNDGSCGR